MKKRCSKCKTAKDIVAFSKNKSKKSGYHSICKNCVCEYREQNKKRIKEYDKFYYLKNKKRIIDRIKSYNKQHGHMVRKSYVKNKEKYRDADFYIIALLKKQISIGGQQISPQVIEAKRIVLKLKREIKKTKEIANEFFGN